MKRAPVSPLGMLALAGVAACGCFLAEMLYDTEAPDFSVTFVDPVSGLTVTAVKAGATVHIHVVASENLQSDPTVLVGGRQVTAFSGGGQDTTFSYTVQGSDPEGPMPVSVVGIDKDGNIGYGGATLTLDFTGPSFMSITASPNPAGPGAPVSVSFAASEMLAATPSVTVAGNAASFVSIAGLNYTYSYAIRGTEPDGPATITVAGSDLAGNPGNSTGTVTLDVIGPAISGFDIVQSATNQTTVSIAPGLGGSDSGSGIQYWLVRESPAAPTRADMQGLGSSTPPTTVQIANTQGTHTLYCWAMDAVGNLSNSLSDTVTLDTVRPTLTGFNVVEQATNSTTVRLSGLAASDGAGTGVARWLVREGTTQPTVAQMQAGSTSAPANASILPVEGQHTLACWVMDQAGNISTCLTDTVYYDVTAPQVVAVVPASGQTGVFRNAVVQATFSEPMNAGTINSGVFMLYDQTNGIWVGGTTVSYSTASNTATLSLTPPAEMNPTAWHVVYVFSGVEDVAGNVMPADFTSNFMTGAVSDYSAPSVDSFSIAEARTSGPVTINMSESDDTGVIRWLIVDGTASQPTADQMLTGYSSRPTTHTVTGADGTHTLYAWVMDGARNISPSGLSDTVVLDRTPPAVTGVTVTPNPAKVGHTLTIGFQVNESLLSDPTVWVAGGSASYSSHAGSSYTYTYAVSGAEPEGPVAVDIEAVDVAGNVGYGGGSVQLDFTAPSIFSFNVVETSTYGPVSISMTETDGTGTGVVRWRLVQDDPATPSEVTMWAALTGRPGAFMVTGVAGSHTVYCCVMDAAGNISAPASDTVTLQSAGGDSYEPDDGFAQAKPIVSGDVQPHSIHRVGDQDFVTFALTGTADVVLSTSGPGGYDPEMYLYNSSYSQIGYSDDAVGLYPQISTTLPAGTYYAMVRDLGNNGTIDSYTLSLTVSYPESIAVTSPNGGQVWPTGSVQTITWTSSGVTELRIELSRDGGATWELLAEPVDPASGSYTWLVSAPASPSCLVRVQDAIDGTPSDQSDATFTITGTEWIAIASPNGGETWPTGSPHAITWTAGGVSDVRIELSRNGGSTWEPIASPVPASDGCFWWYTTLPSSTSCLVRIFDVVDNNPYDESDGLFTITDTLPADGYEPDDYFTQATSITPGEVQTHSLHHGDDEDYVTFTLTDNANVVLDTAGTDGDPEMHLFDSSYNQIAYNDDYGDLFPRISAALPAGTYYAMVTPLYSHMIASYTLTLTASFQESIAVVSPNGGEVWPTGFWQTIEWTAVGVAEARIELSRDGGATWELIANYVNASNGWYDWLVSPPDSAGCLIRVADSADGTPSDQSDYTFTVGNAQTISLTSPNGGESWLTGSPERIAWTSSGISNVRIELTRDGGATWVDLASSVWAGFGYYDWIVTGPVSTGCYVRVSDAADLDPVDQSNGPFAVAAAPGRIIGSSADEWWFPFGTYFHDARTQVIYHASEIGGPMSITGLGLYVNQIPPQTMNAWTIRMKHTPLSEYATAQWEGTGWTQVYQANETVSATGWVVFTFQTPFDYDGASNLMVDFSFNNTSYTDDGYCRCTYTSQVRSVYYQTDSGYGDPLTWSGTSPMPDGSAHAVPNIMLLGTSTGGDLVGYWTFDDGIGSTATDSSAYGNDGTVVGAYWTPGLAGDALEFNGFDSHVVVPSSPSLNPTDAITVSAWVYAYSWDQNNRIVQKGAGDNQYLLRRDGGSGLNFALYGVAGGNLHAAVPPTWEWHHVAGTYDGATIALYVDGAVVASSPASGPIAATSDDLHIGHKQGLVSIDAFDGVIDDVRIYSRALSPSEVLALAAGPSTPIISTTPSALVFAMEEGGANPAPQGLNVTNVGGGTLAWSAWTDGATWLGIGPTTGGDGTTITVSVAASGYPVGSYDGTIYIEDPAAVPATVAVPVTLSVGPMGIAPAVLSIRPTPDDTQVISTQDVIVQFTTTVDRASAEAAVSLAPAPTYGLVFYWRSTVYPDDTLVIVPDSGLPVGADNMDMLDYDTGYTVTVAGTYTDLVGTTGTGATSTFRTWQEIRWPEIIAVSPSPDALVPAGTCVAGGTFVFTFDTDMDESHGHVDLYGGPPDSLFYGQLGGVKLSADIDRAEFKGLTLRWISPTQLEAVLTVALDAGQMYFLTVTNCQMVERENSPNLPALPKTFTYVTAGLPSDVTPPVVLSISPASGATVDAADAISILFSEAINPATVGNITITGANKSDFDIAWARVTNCCWLEMVPLKAMPPSSTITVTVPTSVKDAAGMSLLVQVSRTFYTSAYPTGQPGLGHTWPRPGSMNDTFWASNGPGQMGFTLVDSTGKGVALDEATLAGFMSIHEKDTGILVRGMGTLIPANRMFAEFYGRNVFNALYAPWVFAEGSTYVIDYSGMRDVYGRAIASPSYEFTVPPMGANQAPLAMCASVVPIRYHDGSTTLEVRLHAADMDGDTLSVWVADDMGMFSAALTPSAGQGGSFMLLPTWEYKTAGMNEPSITYDGWHTFTLTVSDGINAPVTISVPCYLWPLANLPTALSPLNISPASTTPSVAWSGFDTTNANFFMAAIGKPEDVCMVPVDGVTPVFTVPNSTPLRGGYHIWQALQCIVSPVPFGSSITSGNAMPPGLMGIGSSFRMPGHPPSTDFYVSWFQDQYEYDDDPSYASTLEVNGLRQVHNLEPAYENDWVAFWVGDTSLEYNIEIDYDVADEGGELYCDLFDPTLNYTGYTGWNDGPRGMTFAVTGWYYADVYDWMGTVGNYVLGVTTTPQPPGDRYEYDDGMAFAAPIGVHAWEPFETQLHSIQPAGDQDWISFYVGTAGVPYTVEFWDTGINPRIEIHNSVGTLLVSGDWSITYTFGSVGTYYARITEQHGSTGWYTVRVRDLQPDPYEPDNSYTQAADITVSDYNSWHEQLRSLHSSADIDWVRFYVDDISAAYAVRAEGSMSDVTTNIYDGAMTLLASGNRSAVYGGFPAAGYYYARVNSSTGATCFYYVEVTRITPDTYEPNDTPAQAAVVQIDEDCYVTLHSMADVDWMAFYIDTPGAPMRVEAYGVSSIYVEIYNSGLGLLTSGTSQVNWTFGSAGWYYARLAPMTSPTMGEFRVVFQ